MVWLIDSRTNKVSADKYHVNVFRAQVNRSVDRCQLLVFRWIAGSSKVITLGSRDGRERAKAKFRREFTHDAFFPTYSLHNRLLESPIFTA